MSNVYRFSDYKEPKPRPNPVEILEIARDELKALNDILQLVGSFCGPLADLCQQLNRVEQCNLAVSHETEAGLQWIVSELAKVHETLLQRQESLLHVLAELSPTIKHADL